MSCVSTKVANHKLPKDASLFQAYIYKKIYNADTNGNHLINSSSLTCGRAGGIGGYWWHVSPQYLPLFAIMYRIDNLSPPIFWTYHSPWGCPPEENLDILSMYWLYKPPFSCISMLPLTSNYCSTVRHVSIASMRLLFNLKKYAASIHCFPKVIDPLKLLQY